MSHDLSLAQSHAFQLSRDLMVPVIVFEVDGEYGVLPSEEIDAGDDLEIIHEYIPWALIEPPLVVSLGRSRMPLASRRPQGRLRRG
ncbi:hypothetical protein IE4872_PC00480 (plasmid) [Rhizobium gallicum]|uniref:Uncharacterized protein n=2 Tax=Rhizobium TaxID=379 RepID=A0A1L5NRJ3_9HYPH|nr:MULTISPECIES: hypothetical protein [Rhizobium]APO70494.1 hypothetical protein IE4872_PC00480 [Rhizobium gallicum]TCU33583.1 hypothetical protein EV129_11588 [Rhizobium azibense]